MEMNVPRLDFTSFRWSVARLWIYSRDGLRRTISGRIRISGSRRPGCNFFTSWRKQVFFSFFINYMIAEFAGDFQRHPRQ